MTTLVLTKEGARLGINIVHRDGDSKQTSIKAFAIGAHAVMRCSQPQWDANRNND